MVAAVAFLVASFAQPQLFLPHRLIVRVLLQRNADESIAKAHYEADEVNAEALSRMHHGNLPSVRFLLELIRWIDPSYAAQALELASQSFPQASFSEHSPENPSSESNSFLFNINRLPLPLQV